MIEIKRYYGHGQVHDNGNSNSNGNGNGNGDGTAGNVSAGNAGNGRSGNAPGKSRNKGGKGNSSPAVVLVDDSNPSIALLCDNFVEALCGRLELSASQDRVPIVVKVG